MIFRLEQRDKTLSFELWRHGYL